MTTREYGPRVLEKDLKRFREEQAPSRCPIFNIPLDEKAVVDHDHVDGRIRGVISDAANRWIGKVEKNLVMLSRKSGCGLTPIQALERLVEYLQRHETHSEVRPYHPGGLRDLVRKFKTNYKKSEQIDLLVHFEATDEEIDSCKNERQRCNLFRKLLMEDNTHGSQES